MTSPLDAARALLEAPDPLTRGLWARAAALLARQALEEAVAGVLAGHAGAVGAPFAVQLLVLPEVLGDVDVARRAGGAWAALSAAIHHHGYELSPTAEELAGWIGTVAELERAARWRAGRA